MRKLILFFLVVFLASCGSEKGELQAVLGSGHFRGHNIGDKRKSIENSIKGIESLNSTESSLNYERTVNGIEVVSHYDFEEENLYSIQADLFFPDSSALNSFQNKLIENYNDKYGEVDLSSGFLVWQESGKVEFTLADESVEFGQPKLSLTIYNFDY